MSASKVCFYLVNGSKVYQIPFFPSSILDELGAEEDDGVWLVISTSPKFVSFANLL